MNKEVIIGGILRHSNGGYGFRITTASPNNAQILKERINSFLMHTGYEVCNEQTYHDNNNIDEYKEEDE